METIARDWRFRVIDQIGGTHPTENQIAIIKLPFELTPETSPDIPDEYTKGIQYFRIGEAQVPWDGYYANYNGANLAVANAFGVWFEIRKRDSSWEAYHLARYSLRLKDWPCDSINLSLLDKTGEPLPTSRATTPASSYQYGSICRSVSAGVASLSLFGRHLTPPCCVIRKEPVPEHA